MPTTNEFGINSVNNGGDEFSSIVRLADGGFVAIWHGGGNSLVSPAIEPGARAQFFNADGSKLGGEVILDNGLAGVDTQGPVTGTQLSNGNVVFYWGSTETSGGNDWGVRARMFDPSGNPLGTGFAVEQDTQGNQYASSIVALTGGRFVAIWENYSDPAAPMTSADIRARVYNADGTPAGNEFTANPTTVGAQTDAKAVALSNGDFVVSWVDRGSVNSSPEFSVRAQRFDSNGNASGSEVIVAPPSLEFVFLQDITALDNGSYIASWRFSASNGNQGLKGQIFDATGQALSAPSILLAPAQDLVLSSVQLSGLAGGGFAVMFTEFRPGVNTTDAAVQLFNDAGTAVGNRIITNLGLVGAQDFTHGTVLANGDLAVTWTSVGAVQEIRGRIFSIPQLSSTAGNGDHAAVSINENSLAVADFSATDSSGGTLIYSIVGGADATKFRLDPVTNQLSFTAAPDADAAGDVGADNIYDVVIRVSNGIMADEQRLAITVNNLKDGVTINGTAGNDVVSATRTVAGQARPTTGEDVILGGDGNDNLNGLGGDDYIDGGNGNDTLIGDAGNDRLIGGNGADKLFGGDGSNTLEGGAGDDTYNQVTSQDTLIELAGGGVDTVIALESWTLGAYFENLALVGTGPITGIGNALANRISSSNSSNTNDVMRGMGGNDILMGGGGDDQLFGDDGNDTLNGGTGDDAMTGGIGNDTYYVDSSGDVVSELFNEGSDIVRTTIDYVLTDDVERLLLETAGGAINGTGNALANTMTGNTFDNVLVGLGGRDTMNGGNGNDKLIGGAGADSLNGGAGSDTFVFDILTPSTDRDLIRDFHSEVDVIAISRTAFVGLADNSAGALSAGVFSLGSVATSAEHRIIYNAVTGGLFYDADGVGGMAQVQIAALTGAPVLSEVDFLLI